MQRIVLFGFGSLIGEASLRATAPNATDIRPAYIKGFVRDFSLWDSIGFTETNLDLTGIPFCALDIQNGFDPDARVNGVSFSVDEEDFEKILVRERDYEVIETEVYDYKTNKLMGVTKVFSSGRNDGSFDFDSQAGMRYLDNYLDAGRERGDKYYQELLETTFIDGKSLNQYPQLMVRPFHFSK